MIKSISLAIKQFYTKIPNIRDEIKLSFEDVWTTRTISSYRPSLSVTKYFHSSSKKHCAVVMVLATDNVTVQQSQSNRDNRFSALYSQATSKSRHNSMITWFLPWSRRSVPERRRWRRRRNEESTHLNGMMNNSRLRSTVSTSSYSSSSLQHNSFNSTRIHFHFFSLVVLFLQ